MINKRICYIEDNICIISLPNNGKAFVDVEVIDMVSKHNWSVSGTGYVMTRMGSKMVKLNKFLYPNIGMTDHINGNKLDNRSCNLRSCNHSSNGANCLKRVRNTSGFKGVTFHKDGKWRAKIRYKGEDIHIGLFSSPIEASKAYESKAKELFGEFCKEVQ